MSTSPKFIPALLAALAGAVLGCVHVHPVTVVIRETNAPATIAVHQPGWYQMPYVTPWPRYGISTNDIVIPGSRGSGWFTNMTWSGPP